MAFKTTATGESQGDGIDSRKFVITILGLLLVSVICGLVYFDKLEGDQISGIVTSIAGITGAYVLGQGYADGQKVRKA